MEIYEDTPVGYFRRAIALHAPDSRKAVIASRAEISIQGLWKLGIGSVDLAQTERFTQVDSIVLRLGISWKAIASQLRFVHCEDFEKPVPRLIAKQELFEPRAKDSRCRGEDQCREVPRNAPSGVN